MLKQNLKKFFGNVKDNRKDNFEEYFSQLIKVYKDELPDDSSAGEGSKMNNLKQFVMSQEKLSDKEKNGIFYLHNNGSEDEVYAMRMMQFVQSLRRKGKLEKADEERILLLSIDWPVDIQIEYIPTNKE